MISHKIGLRYACLLFSALIMLAFAGGGCAGAQSAIRAAPVLKSEQPSMEQSLARLGYVEKASNLSSYYMNEVPIGSNSEWPAALAEISKKDTTGYYDRLHCKGPYAVEGRFILPLVVLVEKFEETKRGLGTASREDDYPNFFDAFVDLTGKQGIKIKKKYDAWMATVVKIARYEGAITDLKTKNDVEGTSSKQIAANDKKIEKLKTRIDKLNKTADKQFDVLIPLIEDLATRKKLVSKPEKMELAKKLHAVSLHVSNLQTEAALTVMIALVQFGRAVPNAPSEVSNIVNRWKEEISLNINVSTVGVAVVSGELGDTAGGAMSDLKDKALALLDDALSVPSRIGQLGSVLGKSNKFNSTIADALGKLISAPPYKAANIDLQSGVFSRRPGNCTQILAEYSAAVAAGVGPGGDVAESELKKKSGSETEEKTDLAKRRAIYPGVWAPTVEMTDDKIVGKGFPAISEDGTEIVYLAVYKRADGDSYTAKFCIVNVRTNEMIHEEMIVEEGSFTDFAEVKGKVTLQVEKINKYLKKGDWLTMNDLYQSTAEEVRICKRRSIEGTCTQIIDIGEGQLLYDEPNLKVQRKVRKMKAWRDKGYCAYPKKVSANSSRCKTVCKGSAYIASVSQALNGETLLIRIEHDVQGDFCEGTVPRFHVLRVAKKTKKPEKKKTYTECDLIWTEHTVDGSFDSAHSVYAADVDGDGDMDVLGASWDADAIVWWENNAGDGTAWTKRKISGAFNGAKSVYAADVDGDGDMDVLGAAFHDSAITWWENTVGDGTAWTKRKISGAFNGAQSIYATDVDGDGDMDVLGAASKADAITWWENTAGDGSTWTEHIVDGAFKGAYSVYATDVDGDGDMDVLGASKNDNAIAWWENTAGNGTAWTKHTVDGSFKGARSVHAADMDGDGDMDVLGAAVVDDDITWWENTAGNGTTWTEHPVGGAFDGAVSVHAADVDGDGDMDVLGAARNADAITWWENTTGDGSTWIEYAVDGAFDKARSVYAADVDGDGDMDVLGAAYNDDDITWWESDCGP